LVESLPLDALAPGGVRGATATGSILTTFMIEGKKTRYHLKSEPKGLSERELQIYELRENSRNQGRRHLPSNEGAKEKLMLQPGTALSMAASFNSLLPGLP